MELEMAAAAAAASAESRQLEAIFIATPPCTPLIASLTRTTTPRDLPTMYHFDFPNMSSTAAEDESLPPPPGPLTTGLTVPIPEEGETSNDLTPCPNCSRTFNLNALRKHVIVCEKTLKKRKPFDSSRQRRDGTALSTYVLPKNFGLPNAEKASGVHSPPVSREASTLSTVVPHKVAVGSPQPAGSNLIRSTARGSMRRAGGATITAAAESVPAAAPAAPATMNRDGLRASERSVTRRSIKGPASERCPHCDRSFNLKAFDRHVEWCKEKAIQAHIKQNTIVENNKAKERMEARKQYRPPNLKTKRAINRDKYSGTQEEQYEAEMVAQKQNIMSHSSMTSSVQSDNGLSSHASNKYDPFLSAKRQLEELCSPNTPPDNEPLINSTVTTPTMSTSLTSTLGKLYINTPTTTATTPKVTPMSSFRRTSSLRGPRRTPLLPSRPLFASNYRPTIQRGLSDEGPISSNFLKPEEFDEMPVRAACVNDFHSPRVIRRDTSASNRKQHLKLPLGGATESDTTTNTPSTPKPTVRNVAKTDSLAVFLNYEHELEQLNAKAAEVAAHTKELSSKELKDKSNNLSKQNSAKNLATNPSSGPLPPLTLPNKENHVNLVQTYATPLRLEPISKPMTPVTPNSSGSTLPIKLESIFGVGNRLGDYIDPKLINACDNLHVQQSSTGSSEASSTPQQISQSRSSSQSTITMGPEQRRHSGEARNLLKRKMRLGRNQFLYDASPEEAYISSGSCADDEANRSSLEFDEQCWQQQQKQLLSKPLSMPMTMPTLPVLPTFDDFDFEEFLSSFENENDEEQFPLFRDCREFLLNRTTSRQRSFQKATSTPQTQTQTQTQTQIQTQLPTPTATQRPSTTGCQFKSNFYAATTKDPHAHRSDSNVSSSGGSMKSTTVNSSGSYKTPNSSSGSYKTTLNSSGEKMQRQQSNISTGSSSNSCHGEHAQKLVDDSQKREIFISIETEPNAQGRSPISPDSLRHMVGNAQTPIDVLHIENGNEPEHAKFSKISDTEDHLDAELDDEASHVLYKKRLTSMASTAAKTITAAATAATTATTTMPNVEANNAKNVLEKMRCDFKQLGEDVGASMRRDILQRQEQIQQQQQLQAQQDTLKVSTPLTPSPSGDSDELSSLDGYPMSSSQSSRRGAGSKLSSDSAYGSTNSPFSLSRQRSSELQSSNNNTPRSQTQLRPHTASGSLTLPSKTSSTMMNALMQATSNYGTPKTRQRLFAGSGGEGGLTEYSSSSSEHLVPQQQQQQQQQQQPQQQQQSTDYNYNNKSSNSSYELNAKNLNNNNNNNNNNSIGITPTTSQHSLLSNNSSNGSSSMSASMKMSKFCHECGGKFVIEHAKFCMECGVKRVVL